MELTKMANIGTELEKKLNAIEINSAEQLSEIGSKEAFFHLKTAYPEVCLVHLYALQGAIDNTGYNMLSEDVKRELKAFSDSLR